ncbi:sugar kinase [Streptomyces sp. ME03-5709C]|nr:sugar kinase [Streptomyces sp. ME03-5709C]
MGDPLLALLPTDAVTLDHADELLMFCGGAEVNTAIGVSRLGIPAGWLGRVGRDAVGRKIIRTLTDEQVDTSLVVVDDDARTGVYLREWLPDGVRRPYYYRGPSSGGARLSPDDWPRSWPPGLAVPTVLHVTGINSALSSSADAAVHSMISRARVAGAVISVDPNYRPALWSTAEAARTALLELAAQADILLLSEEDASLMYGSVDPRAVSAAADPVGRGPCVVLKCGARGAVVAVDGQVVPVPPAAATALDPVGAGDGFNAGFLAATMRGASPLDAARCGAWCGARAVEHLGESSGYPRLEQLPADIAALLSVHEVSR